MLVDGWEFSSVLKFGRRLVDSSLRISNIFTLTFSNVFLIFFVFFCVNLIDNI